ncbi:SDR family NAD(P)-dependent oxidoreductase [Pedobacter sp. MC2016-24]|uniref:SDR family NAD(P)-dependent oxidoreductase n=1 Tax=Pedobacter sp. MC2016-24 TaxID=2780090 RepID=UPI001D161BDB|nr:SDR family NAD(P)-dependent oxidoreductase [Pedobacter sp. MC2016-24]
MNEYTSILARFKDQVAVVSGAADGLGKAIALRLAGEGAKMVLFDFDRLQLEKTLIEFKARGYAAIGVEANISLEEEVINGFAEAYKAYGRIDVMINSAGIVGPTSTSILDYPVADFDKVYQVNLRGAFLMAKYALTYMSKGGYGRILLLASIAGKEGNPFMAGYSSTKAGVIGLVKGLGKEFATTGITVNGLAPAVIKTAMNEHTAPEQLAYMTSKIPMNRLGTVEEVAAISSYIVSAENSFSTGFIYDISGGRATY